jgi:hypothetical protein
MIGKAVGGNSRYFAVVANTRQVKDKVQTSQKILSFLDD